MKVSVVIVTYRRFDNLRRIIDTWLAETPDVWLCDCSENGVPFSVSDVHHCRFYPDPGNRVRHAVATLTSGDIVIKADDDILPRPGLAADFVKHMGTLGPSILGIHGRIFRGPRYYGNTKHYGSKSITKPLRVHFVGVTTCAPREYLAMDLRGCDTETEDLYWQMKCYPKVPKYVIQTDKFMNLPESKDSGRLCQSPKARAVRERFYREYYLKHYAK